VSKQFRFSKCEDDDKIWVVEVSEDGGNTWEREADRDNWEEDGLPCAIRRTDDIGHLCGYVGIPADHPVAGTPYTDLPLRVHGGLTYSKPGDGDYLPEGHWWVGFDCAHAGDITPATTSVCADRSAIDEEYRSMEYVRRETKHLAWDVRQLLDLFNDLCPDCAGEPDTDEPLFCWDCRYCDSQVVMEDGGKTITRLCQRTGETGAWLDTCEAFKEDTDE